MGIQINGQTDTISASDGGLSVSGYELTGASNINVTGIVTATGLDVTNIKHPSFGSNTFVLDSSGNINIDSGGVYYDASNNRLAIGTTDPGSYFSDARNLVIESGTDTGITIRSSTTTKGTIAFADGTTGADAYRGYIQYFHTENALSFATNGTERFRVDTSGRFLVGTSTSRTSIFGDPARFQVEGNAYQDGAGSFIVNSNTEYGPSISFGKSRGTSSGSFTAVTTDDRLGLFEFFGANGSALNTAARIECRVDGAVSGGGANDMPGRLVFSTTADGASSPTERMRLSKEGRLDVFADTPLRPRSSTSAGTSDALLYGLHSATNTTNGTAIYAIWTNGTTQILSDQRQKKNIETTRSGYLEDLQKLRVVKYHWNTQQDDEPKELGLIAQEVEQIFPGLVSSLNQADETIEDLKGIKTSVIQFMLLKALQEAAEKIETLEAKVAALEGV